MLPHARRFAGSLGRSYRGALHYDGGLTSFIPSIQGCLTQKVSYLKHDCNAYLKEMTCNKRCIILAQHIASRAKEALLWVPGDLLPSFALEEGSQHRHQPARAV